MRYSDLKTQKNDLTKIKSGFDVVDLGGFNSGKECFYLSIFVGHKDTAFNTESRAFKKTELSSKHIKLVILTGLIPVPAIPFAFIFDQITHGDTIFGQDFKGYPHHFQSSTIDECLSYYQFCVGMLQENYYDSLDQWKAHIDIQIKLMESSDN